MPGLADVVGVAVGGEHACALRADGRVLCWGSNTHGLLGSGAASSSPDPIEIAGVEDAVQVVCGGAHTCVLRKDGEVLCWGSDADGQVGAGQSPAASAEEARSREPGGPCSAIPRCRNAQPAPATSSDVDAPTRPNVHDAIELGAGANYTCALRRTGEVACWGELLRDMSGSGLHFRTGIVPVPGLPPIAHLFSADAGSAGVARDGRVFVWGQDPRGNGDDGATHEVPEARGAEEVDPDWRLLVRFADGRVTCQGDSRAGGCGALIPGSSLAFDGPSPIRDLTAGAIAVASGSAHACAMLRGGAVRCWGDDGDGQLGDAPVVGPQPTPVRVDLFGRAHRIALGRTHSCAILDRSVQCWGRNGEAALGVGEATAWSPRPMTVPGVGRARDIAAAASRTLVVRDDGDVLAWGTLKRCRGEPGGPWMSWTPARSPLGPAVRVVVGDGTECASTPAGIRCLGEGFRRYDEPLSCRADPVPLELPGTARSLGRGEQACAALAGRDVACWGSALSMDHPMPGTVPRALPAPARAISADIFNACACLADGRVACIRLTNERPAEVLAGIHDCTDVARTGPTLCVLRRDRTVWCVGDNQFGTLGDGTLLGHDDPAPVTALRDVVQLEAGGLHVCARTQDGAVWCWGERGDGQLGDGTGGGIRPEGRDVLLP